MTKLGMLMALLLIAPAAFAEMGEGDLADSSDSQQVMQEMEDELNYGQAAPESDDGSEFRIETASPGGFYDRLGLQNGEVIHTIDGEPAYDPASAMEMLTGERSRIEVSRDSDSDSQ